MLQAEVMGSKLSTNDDVSNSLFVTNHTLEHKKSPCLEAVQDNPYPKFQGGILHK